MMQLPRIRFTIRSLMIAVAVVAVVLALSPSGWFLFLPTALYLSPAVLLWWMFRHFRRLATWGFGATATLASGGCAVQCIYHQNFNEIASEALTMFVASPLILGLGAAWATAALRRDAARRPSPISAKASVVVVAFLPLTIVVTHWPLRLAFLISEPALNRLADRVASGQDVGRPLRAGAFMVVGSTTDPPTGKVGLITVRNPRGRCRFVRMDPGLLGDPFSNRTLRVLAGHYSLQLSDRWRHEDD
jgi:hypothetical protein